MCGRSSLHDAPRNVLERFKLPPVIPGFSPRYNIAPSQDQWTIGLDSKGHPNVRARRWGLIPYWASDPSVGSRMINARSDSLEGKPAFRESVQQRRCLILADGYYEWMAVGKSKVPLHFHMKGHAPFVMAGLWDRWKKAVNPIETCAVITTDASSRTVECHPRMPALLSLDDAERWLDRDTSLGEALALLRPYQGEDLEFYEVSKLVNNAAVDSPACIEPAGESKVETVSQLSLLPD